MFFLSMVQNHRRQTTNPTQTQPTNTQTKRKPQQRTQAGRPWASRLPPCNREAALDQLAQRQPSSNRARPTEAPKTQPNNDEQQNPNKPNPKPRPNKPNPKPRQTNPKPRTNTPHTLQIAGALYAGASWECNAKDSPLDF